MKNKQHPSLQQTDALQSICKPLFDNTRVTYFSHCMLNKNNQFSGLTSHLQFSEVYINKEYYNHDIHALKNIQGSLYIAWDVMNVKGRTKEMIEDARQFNLAHTFSIIKKEKEHIDCFHFAGQIHDDAINEWYHHNLDFLSKFILYYKEKVNANKNLREVHNFYFNLNEDQQQFYTHTENFIPSSLIELNRYVIGINQPPISK